MSEEHSNSEEVGTLLDVTRWHKEQADPDFDEESVTHLLEDRSDAEFVEWYPGPPEGDSLLARFRVTDVSEDRELVDYSIEISENLLQEAIESLSNQKHKRTTPTADSTEIKDSPSDDQSLEDFL